MDARLPVVSLFSGAGGLDLAAERCTESSSALTDSWGAHGPLRVAVATDYDSPALATLSKNSPETTTVRRHPTDNDRRASRGGRPVSQRCSVSHRRASVYAVQQVGILARGETDEHGPERLASRRVCARRSGGKTRRVRP